MAQFSGSITARGYGTPFRAEAEGETTFIFAGTFNATVRVEKATSLAMLSWVPVSRDTTGAAIFSLKTEKDDVYRIRVTAFTSGSVAWTAQTPGIVATFDSEKNDPSGDTPATMRLGPGEVIDFSGISSTGQDLNKRTFGFNPVAGALEYKVNGLSVFTVQDGGQTSFAEGSIKNYRSQNMLHWRAAVARVRAGTGRGRLLVISDSTGMGAGSGSGGTTNLNGAFPHAWPQALANTANPFVPFSTKSFIGTQASQVAYGTYDTRVTLGTGWVSGTGVPTLGAALWSHPAGTAGTLAFTPVGPFDSILIPYVVQAAQGTITVNVDGGASLGVITCTGSGQQYVTQSYSCALGTHTLNQISSTNTVFSGGAICWDSTVPAIDVVQGCWYGARAANFDIAGSAWNPIPAIGLFAPDLTIIALTINDSNGGTSLDDYRTQLQAIITAAQLTGDVLLMTGAPSNTLAAINGTLAGFVQVVSDLAVLNNVPMLSIVSRWVSYAAVSPVLPYYDTLHPQALGYQDIAAAVYEVLAKL